MYITSIRDIIKKLREDPNGECKAVVSDFTVQIKGGRFEVNLVELTKRPIYWEDKKDSFVRRYIYVFQN